MLSQREITETLVTLHLLTPDWELLFQDRTREEAGLPGSDTEVN